MQKTFWVEYAILDVRDNIIAHFAGNVVFTDKPKADDIRALRVDLLKTARESDTYLETHGYNVVIYSWLDVSEPEAPEEISG